MKKPSQQLIATVKAMAEIYGKTMTDAAALLYLAALAHLPEAACQAALQRCLKELRQFPTVADVLARAQALDGRPGPEEAWALLPKDEAATAVWTDEMADAYRIARTLMREGDMIGARMAFKEAYLARVQEARDAGRAAAWSATLGHDVEGRRVVIEEAVRLGRLPAEQARAMLPDMTATDPRVKQLVANVMKALPPAKGGA